MKRDPLLTPTLSDRPVHAGAWPWRLPSLYFLAFFGGGAAAAAISYFNARRLGLSDETAHKMLGLGAGYLLLFGLLVGAIGGYSASLDPGAREVYRDSLRSYRLLVPIVSLGLTWLLVRAQIRGDRLYQIESGGEHRYSSLWAPGLAAAIASVALHILVLLLGVFAWQAGGMWTHG